MVQAQSCPVMISTGWHGPNLPDGIHPFQGVALHNTANADAGADAAMHSRFVRQGGGPNGVSFTHAVDSVRAVQIVKIGRTTWQASDGFNGPGNNLHFSIESCENADGDIHATANHVAWIIGMHKFAPWYFDHEASVIDRCHVIDNHPHQFFAPDHKYCPHVFLDMGIVRDIFDAANEVENHIIQLSPEPKRIYFNGSIRIGRITGPDTLTPQLNTDTDPEPDCVEIEPRAIIRHNNALHLLTVYGTLIPLSPLRTMTLTGMYAGEPAQVKCHRGIVTVYNASHKPFDFAPNPRLSSVIRAYGFM